jgi:hypothetical protein
MNRNEYGQFTKEKKGKSATDVLEEAGIGGAAGAGAGYGAGKGVKKASEYLHGRIGGSMPATGKEARGAKDILQGMIEKNGSKIGKLETLLKRAGGAKGLALKGGAAGLAAGGIAALMSKGDDDEDDDGEEN